MPARAELLSGMRQLLTGALLARDGLACLELLLGVQGGSAETCEPLIDLGGGSDVSRSHLRSSAQHLATWLDPEDARALPERPSGYEQASQLLIRQRLRVRDIRDSSGRRAGMIRVLLMGREAPAWSPTLGELAEPAALELEAARLPAEGIRRFEATPPDAVVILDEQGGARSRTLLQALQTRPLGRLVPLLLISPAPGSHDEPEAVAAELSIHAWRPVETSARELLVLLARVLEVPAADLLTPGPTPPAHPGQRQEGGFLIEPLEDAGGDGGRG